MLTHRLLIALLVLVFGPSILVAQRRTDDRWVAARERMVERAIVGQGIENSRVIEAMRTTPRHEFLPDAHQSRAYRDMALPIGGGQTITSPFVVARMTEAIDPQPTDRVLEIGTGSGYQAAVLSPLVKEVYSIEIVDSLARRAARTLRRLDYENVFTKAGDGFLGWPEHAPFDKIIVTCSPENVPQPLIDQLAEGGQVIVPLGQRYQQTLYHVRKIEGQMVTEALEPTFFVPMTGEAEERRTDRATEGRPTLVNGSFEKFDNQQLPIGWYYIRQAKVTADQTAPEGKHVLQIARDSNSGGGQLLQALGMDGRQIRRIRISARVAGHDIRAGRDEDELPRIEITFYNRGRAPIGTSRLGNWQGTFTWQPVEKTVAVPSKARLAVLAIAMYGSVGELRVDQLQVGVVAER